MLQKKGVIDEVIDMQLAIAKKGWEEMAKVFFQKVDLRQFDIALKVFSEVLAEHNQKATRKLLNQALNSASFKLKMAVFEEATFPKLKDEQQIIVKKSYERQHQQNLLSQWIKQRSIFFTYQINAKLNQARIPGRIQKKIMKLFLEQQSSIDLDNLGEMQRYRKQIQSLKQLLEDTNKCHQKLRECPPMQQIIRSNLGTLKVIRICYKTKVNQQNFNNQCRYSISAFELFRVVHANKLLNQVTLKGMQVCQFLSFIKLLRCASHQQSVQQIKQLQTDNLCWMKSFNPPKSLKLSIDAMIQFNIQEQQDSLAKMNDLQFFRSLFGQLSDITAQLNLGALCRDSTSAWASTLQQLWKFLKDIKKIKIKIHQEMQTMFLSQNLSILFGRLACFKQITQLEFKNIVFYYESEINHYLAVEQSLSTLFKNNAVNQLVLNNCRRFPIFPKITTLKSIHLCQVSFRKKSELVGNNPSLRSIKLVQIKQEVIIDGQLFNQLETLSIQKCQNIYFADMLSQSPSNITHLSIKDSNIGVYQLSVIFPKLSNLSCLKLDKIDFEGSLLCSIPSLRLEELHILGNQKIKDVDLEVIDSKWPFIRAIFLSERNKISESVWSVCKFKGLMQLGVNKFILKGITLQDLKRRGLKINQMECGLIFQKFV